MRIDKFLKNSRLIKRRTVAKDACTFCRTGQRVMVCSKVKELELRSRRETESEQGELVACCRPETG